MEESLETLISELFELKKSITKALEKLFKKIELADSKDLQVEVLTRKELANRLGISDGRLREYIRRGIIPEMRVGHEYRYNWKAVVTSLENSNTESKKIESNYKEKRFSNINRDTPIVDCDMSVRLFNILLKDCPLFQRLNRYDTPISVLEGFSTKEFLSYKNAGKASLAELKLLCDSVGIRLSH